MFDYSFNSTVPHTTNCTQSSILVLIPLIFLILFSPLVLYDLKKSRHPPLQLYSPTVARIVSLIIIHKYNIVLPLLILFYCIFSFNYILKVNANQTRMEKCYLAV